MSRAWALLLALCACTESVEVLGPMPIGPDPGCGLENAAFCETFERASPSGRGAPLYPARWQMGRFTYLSNPPQGFVNAWEPASGPACGAALGPQVPPQDLVECGGQLQDLMSCDTTLCLHDMSPRQPFDFSGRVGKVTWDHAQQGATLTGAWMEVWLTEDPAPVPMLQHYSDTPDLRRGVGIEFQREATGCPAGALGVSRVEVIDGYAVASAVDPSGLEIAECFPWTDGTLEHFELDVSQSALELWVTAMGQPAQRVMRAAVQLPFSRGFVHFEQNHWAAETDTSLGASRVFTWDNVAFDGPTVAGWTPFEVPDALTPDTTGELPAGSVGTGYATHGASTTVTVPSVTLAGSSEALLVLDTYTFAAPRDFSVRINGGDPLAVPDPAPGVNEAWRSMMISVPFSALREGDNTLEVSQTTDGFFYFANVDLLLR